MAKSAQQQDEKEETQPKGSSDLDAASYASGGLNRVYDPKVGHLVDAD